MKLIADIHKKYGEFQLDFEFETEDMLTGFLGASGCGKSLTLKCIAGIETPDSGFVELNGKVLFNSKKNINVRPQERKVGYLFQNYALFPTMTVKNNILCTLYKERDKKVKTEKFESMVKLLHLENLENHYPNQLSGGQAQRTALARILITEPKLLLLDEPFSALDSFLRRTLQTELTELLHRVRRQTIIVTHSQKQIRQMCSNLVLMNSGHIIQSGKTEEVFKNPNSKESRILLEE